MAKLSANGQREVVRFTKESETPESELTSREMVKWAYMDNGVVLTQRVVWFRDDARRHDWGWKKAQKVDSRWVHQLPKLVARVETRGWTVTPGPAYYLIRDAVEFERKWV
jgi:hypothetical protein